MLSLTIYVRKKIIWVFISGGKAFKKTTPVPRAGAHCGAGVLLGPGAGSCPVCVQNMTNTVVRATLRNDLSPEGIIHHMKILSPIHCAFQNDLLTSSGYTPEWG